MFSNVGIQKCRTSEKEDLIIEVYIEINRKRQRQIKKVKEKREREKEREIGNHRSLEHQKELEKKIRREQQMMFLH